MEKSNFTVWLILLMGILTFVSCSSGDDSPNTNTGGMVSCLWDNGSKGKVCVQGRIPEPEGCDGKIGTSCPSNPDKECPMVVTSKGKEYDVDFFVYGYSSYISNSCEFWADFTGGPFRVR
jgi:hypothetical protein